MQICRFADHMVYHQLAHHPLTSLMQLWTHGRREQHRHHGTSSFPAHNWIPREVRRMPPSEARCGHRSHAPAQLPLCTPCHQLAHLRRCRIGQAPPDPPHKSLASLLCICARSASFLHLRRGRMSCSTARGNHWQQYNQCDDSDGRAYGCTVVGTSTGHRQRDLRALAPIADKRSAIE
jgi:hypothetical protein